MARSGIRAAVLIALLVGLSGSVFGFDSAKWKYQGEVTVEEGAGDYGRLALTPDIYNAARGDLGDIRLVDSDSEQVPYVLARPVDVTERSRYKPAEINRSIGADKAAMITLDFGKQVVKNSIEVETSGNNFRRAVKIEGSNDNVEFFTLIERAYVFAVSYDKWFGEVDLLANDYRYLRISVWPMAAEEESPVIEKVTVARVERKYAKRLAVEMTRIEHSKDEESNSSIYVYDLGYRRLPINEIELEIADDAFYRYVTAEGRDAATRKVRIDSEDNRERFREVEVRWQRISSDAVYRYTDADGKRRQRQVLRIPSGRRIYKYLKITVRNYDDKPITVKSVSAKMIAHEVVFAAEDSAALKLYVGSESARAPRYDLEQMLKNPLQVKAKAAKLSGIIDNPLFEEAKGKPLAWTEKHKVLLLIIMVVVVLVLGVFILKSYKSIQSEQAQDENPG